jgi:hypothetical protein
MHQVLQLARNLRGALARSGLQARVSGDVGPAPRREEGERIVLALRCGRYPGGPSHPAVLHPLVPRQEANLLAQVLSRRLQEATGQAWPPVLLWGALAVAHRQGGGVPAPAVAVYLGEDPDLPRLDSEAFRGAVVGAIWEALELLGSATEADLRRTQAEPATPSDAGPGGVPPTARVSSASTVVPETPGPSGTVPAPTPEPEPAPAEPAPPTAPAPAAQAEAEPPAPQPAEAPPAPGHPAAETAASPEGRPDSAPTAPPAEGKIVVRGRQRHTGRARSEAGRATGPADDEPAEPARPVRARDPNRGRTHTVQGNPPEQPPPEDD